jgi:hypothetical protein
VVLALEGSASLALRNDLVATFDQLRVSAADPAGPGRSLRRLGLRVRLSGSWPRPRIQLAAAGRTIGQQARGTRHVAASCC